MEDLVGEHVIAEPFLLEPVDEMKIGAQLVRASEVSVMRAVQSAMKRLTTLGDEELMAEAKDLGAPYELVKLVSRQGKLPVPNFAAGGVATPADASLMMQLGAETIFVGSGVFKSGNPAQRAKAIVEATTHYTDAKLLAQVSENLGEAMVGINIDQLEPGELLQSRGW